ncbi:MAG: cyanophycin synthetase [Patescibacteria group bacterium]
MKHYSRSFVASLLARFARAVLHTYKPTIVMVTGSVGKTSTKDAVAAALSSEKKVRASEKSFNSEFGVPLTIIGAKNPWNNGIAWVKVFYKALSLLLVRQEYPRILVLEVGADRPGDLTKILQIGTPDAVVVTRLPRVPVHVEAYASTDAVRAEEFLPAFSLPPGAPLILASNNEYALSMGKKTLASMTTFGFAENADVHISNPEIMLEGMRTVGMKAIVRVGKESKELKVRGALGRHQLLAPAAALATALRLGSTFSRALTGLSHYVPPSGRSRLLHGMKETTLIDDSYNSSPAAAEEALASLDTLPTKGRKIAALGDMLELGRYSIAEHEKIGALAAKHADILVTVGIRSRATAEAARQNGLAEALVHSFDSAVEAAAFLHEFLEEGDVVLIKGSQGMRMERVTEVLLHDKKDTHKLVRQEKEWKKRR